MRCRVLTLVPLLLLLGGHAGCVTLGTHEEVVAHRDALQLRTRTLEQRVEQLEASNESLGVERTALLGAVEDLRLERESLAAEVKDLERVRQSLQASLESREAEVAELASLSDTYRGLVSDLESELRAGQIEIEQLRDGLELQLSDEILFRSGSAQLGPHGLSVLQRVGGQLRASRYRIEVLGHTDDVPIRGNLAARYPTNWELAGARAARVARLFEEQGIDPIRLSAVSIGPNRPRADNGSAEGRARNRRIEIRLVPEERAGSPSAASEAGR